MKCFQQTIVIRHKKENLKKCSLRGLENRPDFLFFTHTRHTLPPLNGYLLLAVDAPPLSKEDAPYGIILLDATWRYAPKMRICLPPDLPCRSLPSVIQTAYPRRQTDCPDPQRGLASIEALYAAFHLLGRDTSGLLDRYYWKDAFLEKNPFLKD